MKTTHMIAALTAGLALIGGSQAFAAGHLKTGDTAPPYTLYTFGGTKVTSAELAGKVVILNYWATWCGPCKREMVVFDRYVRAHPDVKIFAVATEDSLPPEYLRKLSGALAFPLASGVRGPGFGAMDALPTSYVIDRAGVIRRAEVGAFSDNSLDNLVGPLLAVQAPGTAGSTLSAPPVVAKPAP